MSGRVFISHAGKDEQAARKVAGFLRDGGLSPLLDRERTAAGDSFLAFMQDGLSTSDYCLLLWSAHAASSTWVQVEWEAALHRSVAEARAFLVVGRLDEHPPPTLLAPRLFVELHPELAPGLDGLVRMWREDLVAESRTKKPVASNVALVDEPGVPVYVTSELFGVVVPLSLDLSAPAGAVVVRIRDRLSLPTTLEHGGQIGVRFEYRLVHDGAALEFGRPLDQQGVAANSVLWLECTMQPFAPISPHAGTLTAATFRSASGPPQALKAAQRRLSALIRAARLGPPQA